MTSRFPVAVRSTYIPWVCALITWPCLWLMRNQTLRQLRASCNTAWALLTGPGQVLTGPRRHVTLRDFSKELNISVGLRSPSIVPVWSLPETAGRTSILFKPSPNQQQDCFAHPKDLQLWVLVWRDRDSEVGTKACLTSWSHSTFAILSRFLFYSIVLQHITRKSLLPPKLSL